MLNWSYYCQSAPVAGMVSGTEYQFCPTWDLVGFQTYNDRLRVHSLAISLGGRANAGVDLSYTVYIRRNTPPWKTAGDASRTLLACTNYHYQDAAAVVSNVSNISISPNVLLDPGEGLVIMKEVVAGTTTSGVATAVVSIEPQKEDTECGLLCQILRKL